MSDLTLSERKALLEMVVGQYAYELKKRVTAATLVYDENDPEFGEEFLLKLINKLSIVPSELCIEGL